MFTPVITAALLALAATPPADAEPAAGPGRSEARIVLQKTFDDLWKDTQIGSDEAYQSTFYRPNPNSIAPSDLRKLVIDWPHSRSSYGGFDYNLSIGYQRLTCSWRISFHSAWHAEQSVEHCTAALTALGYRPLKLGEGVPPGHVEGGTSSDQRIRYIGDTEQTVSYGAMPTVGSPDNRSNTVLVWVVRRPYRASLPTLSDILAVAPGAAKATYLGEKFYDALADQPVLGFTVGNPSISFAQPIADKIIAALEQEGFEKQRDPPPLPSGGVQRSWERYADRTYAHVITSANDKIARFSCQPPQHTGPPLVRKPPAHPSLAVLWKDRPILKFEELRFSDPGLAQQARQFQHLAEKLAQPDWHTRLYQDHRTSVDPHFFARWQSSDLGAGAYHVAVRPYRSISITTGGRYVREVDELSYVRVVGTVVPVEGWAAEVYYLFTSPVAGTLRPGLAATIALADAKRSLDFQPGANTFALFRQSVSADVQDGKMHRYYFESSAGERHSSDPNEQKNYARLRGILGGTPDVLRDALLGELEALRETARAKLAGNKGLLVVDMTYVRSDNPPRQSPILDRLPSDEARQQLADEIDKQIAAREALIRENFHKMHAALQSALPADELLKMIPVERN